MLNMTARVFILAHPHQRLRSRIHRLRVIRVNRERYVAEHGLVISRQLLEFWSESFGDA
jgi:hypothetical protein